MAFSFYLVNFLKKNYTETILKPTNSVFFCELSGWLSERYFGFWEYLTDDYLDELVGVQTE